MNSLSVKGGSPDALNTLAFEGGSDTSDELPGRTSEKACLHVISRDEVDGTGRARCGLGPGEYPSQGISMEVLR